MKSQAVFSIEERNRPLPAWLAAIEPDKLPATLPLRELLSDSLYYPACGTDGSMVAEASGYVHSFIYVDYGVTRGALLEALARDGFRGYRVLARRPVGQHEFGATSMRAPRDDLRELTPDVLREMEKRAASAYAEWVVFERAEGFGDDHGSARFSLLYLWADGVASYLGLYSSLSLAPKVLAIVQPGTGFGGNWTNLTDPAAIFRQNVVAFPTQLPADLVHGGIGRAEFYDAPIWPDYDQLRGRTKRGETYLARWCRQ